MELPMKSYTERLLKRPDALNLFSYDDPEGTGLQREAGVAWFQKSGFHTDKEHVLLAAGGQNALTASLGALLERGNKLGTDPLTYPGVKNAACARQAGVQVYGAERFSVATNQQKRLSAFPS